MYSKISRYIYAINFNKQETKDRIVLLDQRNTEIQYIVFNQNEFFTVIKLQDIQSIKNNYGLTDDEVINALFQTDKETILQNKYLYNDVFQFGNIQQLYNYFVSNLKMQQLQFNRYFNNEYQLSSKGVYKNIDYKIQGQVISQLDVKSMIDQLKQIKYTKLFDRLLINFVDKITQRDSNGVGGNVVYNEYGYKIVINIEVGRGSSFRTLLHQLGHCYQKFYLDNKQVEQLYDYVLLNGDKIYCQRDSQFLDIDQFIPQFFAEYYYEQLNEQSRKFVQENILI